MDGPGERLWARRVQKSHRPEEDLASFEGEYSTKKHKDTIEDLAPPEGETQTMSKQRSWLDATVKSGLFGIPRNLVLSGHDCHWGVERGEHEVQRDGKGQEEKAKVCQQHPRLSSEAQL